MSPRAARRTPARLAPGPALVALVVGGTLAAVGGGMVLVALLSLFGDGEQILNFTLCGLAVGALGAVGIALASRQGRRTTALVTPYYGFLSVTLAWVVAAVAGSIPLMISGVLDNPIDGFFEAMSGFTTTGATMIDDYDIADAVLWWRSVMQYLGGIGIVVLVVAIAPVTGTGLQGVFYAEVSGVTNDRLTPRIIDTAKILAGIYLVLTSAAAIAYAVAGMSVFDALNHAMTTLSTGGYSTEAASIAAFDSLAIEIVAIVFMVLAGVNLAFYWRAIRGRELMPQLAEVRLYLAILATAITIVGISLLIADDVGSVAESLRQSAFSTTSIMTGTGFYTVDFDTWNDFARVAILFLMFVGACAGSTSGGLKVIRMALLAKTARQELERQLKPSAVQVLRMGGRPFSEDVRRAVLGFFLIYVLVYSGGALAMAATGVDPITAISAAATSINIVGPGLGEVGGTDSFAAIPEAGRVVSAFLMLTGRLEIFTIVALLAPLFRRRGRGF